MSAQQNSVKKQNQTQKKRLGKGLGNLLDASPESKEARVEAGIVEVPLEKIRASPHNPRKKFAQGAIDELATTIKQYGLLQPILISPEKDHYVVVSGERRLRACRQLGLKTVPSIVKQLPEQEGLEVSLIENIQREELDAIEEAQVYKSLMESYGLTQADLSSRVGKNRTTIANRMRLLQLPANIQTLIADGKVTEGQVRPLLGVKNDKLQLKIAREIETKELNSRQIEELVRNQRSVKTHNTTKKNRKQSPEVAAVEKELEDALETRVRLQHSEKNGSGKVVLSYFNIDELERLRKQLLKGKSAKN